jgi:hypothetical protein
MTDDVIIHAHLRDNREVTSPAMPAQIAQHQMLSAAGTARAKAYVNAFSAARIDWLPRGVGLEDVTAVRAELLRSFG